MPISPQQIPSMQRPYKQVRLESLASAPDQSVAEHLRVVSVAAPAAPAANQLLVRTVLSPIHPCDILSAAGLVPRRYGARDGSDADRYIPGIEAVARVEAVGSGLHGSFHPGQRVFVCCWAPWGKWSEADGVWSEYLLVDKGNVISVPVGISESTAAMFLVIPVTAYVMMLEELKLKRGDWLIQNAAGSALGRWVIAFAQELGIRTINLVRREEQVEELRRETGAEHVLWCPEDGSGKARLAQQIAEITAGERIKGAFDAVGDGHFVSLMMESLSRYGTVIIYGVLAGAELKIPFELICRVPLECLSIRGFSLQNWWLPDTPDVEKRRVFDAVWHHIRDNEALNPAVAEVFPFDRVSDAIRSSLLRKHGKVLLSPRPVGVGSS